MNVIRHVFLSMSLILLAPMAAMAYEVNILTGAGSEAKALDKHQYGLAIERLERRLQHGTGDTDIQLTNLCTAYVATGQLDKATPVCNEAVEANGEFVGTAYNSRGVLNSLKGDFIAALADFENAEDRAHYPRPRSDFGDKAPLNRRFATPEVDLQVSIEIAASNHAEADKVWTARQHEERDKLTARVK